MKKNRRTVFILTGVLSLLLLAAALFSFAMLNSRRITNENREYLRDNAEQIAESLDSAISDGYDNIKILSELVGRSLTSPDFDIASIQGLIQNSVFDFMEFADRDGMDHNITGGVSDARDRRYYLDARAGSCGMELIYVSRATHETLLMFYAPMYYEGGFAGSLVGVYQASNRMTRLLSSEYFGEKAVAYLATEEGRIIASNEGYDPQKEMCIRDLAEEAEALRLELLSEQTGSGVFSLPGNRTGGCMVRLPVNGGWLVQIFPQEANRRMIASANLLGYQLLIFLLLLYAAILVLLVFFYRSQRKQVEEAWRQAEAASRAKTAFLFNMSHDIRTPMNAILGYTDIALRHRDERERVDDSLRKIRTSGGHLLSLINDILEMSRIESGNLALSENPTDIREAVSAVEHMSLSLAAEKKIDFGVILGELRNPYVRTDELHVNEVLINLISNAVKYTPEGGRVRFQVEQLGEAENGRACYRFTVADSGIGMSEEFQEHLFEAFSREETSTVSRIEGAGLGLSIVKKIVDLADGTISVRSRPGEGSVFAVELPFRVMEDEEIRVFRREAQSAGTAGAGLQGHGRVLLVEDNEMNREIALDILTDAGIEAETAENGQIAVELLAERGTDSFDFILMDVQMPVMNGYEATRRIRKLPGGDRIPIIALSANAFREDQEKSAEAGMNAHIAKPININELYATIRELLG